MTSPRTLVVTGLAPATESDAQLNLMMLSMMNKEISSKPKIDAPAREEVARTWRAENEPSRRRTAPH